ncbi:UNVERIFIED_CONTAM: hypothetical protein RMT77_007689 [Armadillidium vulgare]
MSFIKHIFDGSNFHPLNALLISKRVIVTFLSVFLMTSASEIYIYSRSPLGHLLIGGVCIVSVIFLLRFEIRDMVLSFLLFIDKIYSKFFSSKGKPYNCFVLNFIYYILYKK